MSSFDVLKEPVPFLALDAFEIGLSLQWHRVTF